MGTSYKWYGESIRAKIEAEMKRRLLACAVALANRAKVLLNVEGTGRGKGRGAGLVYGANPSHPGEPPHKQRGRLLSSIAWELTGMVSRVGTNVKYGRWLELGTKHVAARPWLRRALLEMRAAIRAILSRPIQ